MLNTLGKNKDTVKDSLYLAKEICEQNLSLTMGSLDVDSLFTNNTLDGTINICINQLFENTDAVESSTKAELKQLLCLATNDSYFIFNGILYRQTDCVAMGSPLGPSLANAFLSYHEKTVVRDIFILFKSIDHLKYFQEFLNSCHINMSFSMKVERQFANNSNLKPQFMINLLLVPCVVILKVFYLLFIIILMYLFIHCIYFFIWFSFFLRIRYT